MINFDIIVFGTDKINDCQITHKYREEIELSCIVDDILHVLYDNGLVKPDLIKAKYIEGNVDFNKRKGPFIDLLKEFLAFKLTNGTVGSFEIYYDGKKSDVIHHITIEGKIGEAKKISDNDTDSVKEEKTKYLIFCLREYADILIKESCRNDIPDSKIAENLENIVGGMFATITLGEFIGCSKPDDMKYLKESVLGKLHGKGNAK